MTLLPHATRRRNNDPKLPHDPTVWTTLLCLAIALALLWILHQVPAARGDVPEGQIVVLPSGEPLPPVADGNLLLLSPLYRASLNPQTKVVDWIAYTLTADLAATDNVLSRNWRTGLNAAALEASDYVGGPYDRGHLVPLASVAASPHAWLVNRMEVIAPQTPALNRGPWLKLEQEIRDRVAAHGTVHVTVGTLYEHEMPPLPAADEPHQVPSHFWVRLVCGDSRRECYLFPQQIPADALPAQYALDEQTLRGRVKLLR